MDDLSEISPNVAFSYLLLWDCILNFCSTAPAELRSIYARWISVHQFEEVRCVWRFKLLNNLKHLVVFAGVFSLVVQADASRNDQEL